MKALYLTETEADLLCMALGDHANTWYKRSEEPEWLQGMCLVQARACETLRAMVISQKETKVIGRARPPARGDRPR